MPHAPELPVSLDSLSLELLRDANFSNPRVNPFLTNCAMSSGFVRVLCSQRLFVMASWLFMKLNPGLLRGGELHMGREFQSNFHTAKLISDKFSSCSIGTWLICMWWWFTSFGKLNLACHQHTISCDIPPNDSWFHCWWTFISFYPLLLFRSREKMLSSLLLRFIGETLDLHSTKHFRQVSG